MDWRIIFSGLQSIGWTVSIAIGVAFAIAMFLLLRRYEARLVPPGVSRVLLALRLLVLLLLLAVFLQPVLTKTWDIERQGRLIVGFDVSDSMETVDRHAAPAEMLRWAQALGMLGNDSTDALLQEWVDAYEAGREPNWSGSGGDDGQDESGIGAVRRRHIEGVFAEFAKMPRTEFVRRLLQSQPNNLLEELSENQVVDLRVFGVENQSIADDQLVDLLLTGREDIRPNGTDAVGLLSESIAENDGTTIRGIVLLTDGRQTEKSDAAVEASRLLSLGIPVYCVPIGSRLAPRDLSIASLQVPQSVYLDDDARLQATITSSGYAGEEVTVKLQQDGQIVDERTVAVASDYFEVDFEIPSHEAGNHEYSITTDVQPGELRDDNNSRDFNVSVVDNKSQVMLVEGDARWEFRYLKSALERDKRVDLSPVLFQQPYLQLLNQPFLRNKLPPADKLKEQLANSDVLIVGDVDPGRMPEAVWKLIEAAVADDGLTLLIVPGKRSMPHGYFSETLKKLLPVSSWRQQEAEVFRRSLPDSPPSVFQLIPTLQAADLTLFRFSSADDAVQTDLSSLPGHPWAYIGTPKPVASVWANLGIAGADLQNEELPAVVHHYYGFGQVVWLGIDSTWRWRLRAGDRFHHRFWGQVVRWGARNKSAAGNDQVRLTLSDVVIDESESVDASIRWNPGLLPQLKGATVELIVESIEDSNDENEKTVSQKIQLAPMKGSPERFTGQVPPMPPGTYKVRLNVENTGLKIDQEVGSELIVQKKTSTELANISCNREFLQQLAVVTGGQVLEPWQLAELPEMLAPEEQSDNVVQERTLWDNWAVMVLFFILLTAEWVIRKINGLP